MSYPGRVFHRKPPPTKAALLIDARMVVMQRQTAGRGLSDHDAASIGRSHGMTGAQIRELWDAETARREGL